MCTFKRPDSLAFPQIYITFKGKDKSSDKIVEYRIQDLPKKYFDHAVNFMAKYFLPDETLGSAINITSKPGAVQAFRDLWHDSLRQNITIGCFKSDNDELVGLNVLVVKSKADSVGFGQTQDPHAAYIFNAVSYCVKQVDIFAKFNVDKYLWAYGLCVNPEYRRAGIGTELLKARFPLMRALGLTVTATIFTAIGSQKAADRAGFKDIFTLSYEDLQKVFPRFDFSKSNTKYFTTKALQL